MPNTSFKFKVSTIKPTVIVFADEFLKKPITKLLRQRGLTIKRHGRADYIVDGNGSSEAIAVAQKQGTKYLRIVIGDKDFSIPEKINWRVLRTDFLAGSQIPPETFLAKIIISTVKNQPLVLPPADAKIFPTHTDDLAKAVWQALVLPGTSKKEFLVLGKTVAAEELDKFLKQLGQTSGETRFSREIPFNSFSEDDSKKTQQQLDWQPELSWHECLEKTFRFFWKEIAPEKKVRSTPLAKENIIIIEEGKEKAPVSPTALPVEEIFFQEDNFEEEGAETEKTEEPPKEKVPKEEKAERSSFLKPIAITFFSLILFLILVWSKPLTNLTLGMIQIKSAVNDLKKYSWEEAKTNSASARNNFEKAEDFAKSHPAKIFLFGLEKTIGLMAEIGKKTARATNDAVPLLANGASFIQAVLKGETFDFNSKIPQIRSQNQSLIPQLAIIEASLKGSKITLPRRWRHLPGFWAEKIEEIRNELTKSEQIIDHLPWIIGLEGGRKTFLVLLQNNMELRSTGGFIGSFALLTFENGELIDFVVKDVYSADGQLKGHIEPPKQIKDILGEENWYLRDSNWDPDFPKSAKNAMWFLRKEIGTETDGVIGINLEAAKKIIEAFGEINITDFNEKINADNLFERAEFWSENEFFPGSTQKMAFLGLLGKQLFEEIKSANPEKYLKIIEAISAALNQKEITIYVNNPLLAKTFYQLNWDGSIRSPVCTLEPCFSDYLYLNEANLGVNKANYFLRRSLEQSVKIEESGKINHQLKIDYENTALTNDWPGGKYTAWLRVYLPLVTKIETVSIYDPLVNTNRNIISEKDREEEIRDGKRIIGFKLEVPIKQRRLVEINFSQNGSVTDEKFGYFLYWQKQPGFQKTPVSLLISFPDTWRPAQINPAADFVSGKLLFSQTMETDLIFGVELEK